MQVIIGEHTPWVPYTVGNYIPWAIYRGEISYTVYIYRVGHVLGLYTVDYYIPWGTVPHGIYLCSPRYTYTVGDIPWVTSVFADVDSARSPINALTS